MYVLTFTVLEYYYSTTPVQLCALRWRIHAAAGLEFFDKVSGALEADTARVRAARRAPLCGVAASLVKQQGYTCTC